MPKERRPVPEEEWQTEVGLPTDINGWIVNPRFGLKEQYGAVAPGAVQFMFDLVDEFGDLVTNPDFPPAYSVGSGWEYSRDGKIITHPTRKNVVGTSMYGRLIGRVTRELKVPMHEYGSPRDAETWDGLGFHWVQEEHTTVSGETKTQLMPTAFLGEKREAPKAEAPTEVESKLAEMVKIMDPEEFKRAAIKVPGVPENDVLLASILDGSYYEKIKKLA